MPLLQTKLASHCATATQLNQQAIVPLLHKISRPLCLKRFNQVIVLSTKVSGYIVYVWFDSCGQQIYKKAHGYPYACNINIIEFAVIKTADRADLSR